MKILAMEHELPGTAAPDFQPFLQSEARKVLELYEKGIIREIYFGKEEHNAVIIMECTDSEEASRMLNELPLVRNKLISFAITELLPYDGFSRLSGS